MTRPAIPPNRVIPAQAGIHLSTARGSELWVRAFAGTTI